jgi:chromate transporter
LPELHRQVVIAYGWMTSDRFTDLFALAQGAPGPNLLVITLIGWDVAGLPGAIAATVAICTPAEFSPMSFPASGTASARRAGGLRSRPA